MKKHSVLLSSLLLVFLFSSTFAQNNSKNKPIQTGKSVAVSTSAAKKNANTENKKTVNIENIEKDLAEALTVIEDKHVKGKDLNYNEIFKSSIEGMLHTLDPHSNYFDAKETEEFRTNQQSQYFGIGALIGDLTDRDGKNLGTYIKATFENAPANRAGLRYGDKILAVNGVSVVGKPYGETREFLLGPRGTTAKITVEKYETGKTETVDIIRDAVAQPSIPEAYMIRPGIGYIAMTGGFNQTTYAEFRQALEKLKAQGMKKLVLDLRNNGGGLVSQAYRVANSFLGRGQIIFSQKGRLDGTANAYRADNFTPDETPLVVLVNRNTASASEILAGALQDHDRALIVGENTFGKGLVQNPFPLEYGSMLLLTIAKYETPAGRLIQRDYSDGNLYNYYTKGGTFADENKPELPKGAEKRTDSGRAVYGGGGIQPDEPLKPQTITLAKARFQRELNNPIFAFVLDTVYGKLPGFENYKVDHPIKFDYDLKADDFSINDDLFNAFKKYTTTNYNFTAQQIENEREFVERTLRTEFVMAAYGSQTSNQVFNNKYDTQLKRAFELFPEAEQLALKGAKANAERKNSEANRR